MFFNSNSLPFCNTIGCVEPLGKRGVIFNHGSEKEGSKEGKEEVIKFVSGANGTGYPVPLAF